MVVGVGLQQRQYQSSCGGARACLLGGEADTQVDHVAVPAAPRPQTVNHPTDSVVEVSLGWLFDARREENPRGLERCGKGRDWYKTCGKKS
eukprot:3462711-Rhodomonas_salina.1